MLASWLTQTLLQSAENIHRSGQGMIGFPEKIRETLEKNPIREWEADRCVRGLKLRLIKSEEYFFRIGSGKAGAFSLFIRNDYGKNVGLRREAITQMATYVSLITDYGYPRHQTRFETDWMDVAVFDPMGEVLIYAENKASSGTLDKLCGKLEMDFRLRIPALPETEDGRRRQNDPLMKAHHIWRNRPPYFWGLSPTSSRPYNVRYGQSGFSLNPIDRIPQAADVPQRDPVTF